MRCLAFLLPIIVFASCHKHPATSSATKPHNIKISFTNTVRGKPLVLASEKYTNQYIVDRVAQNEQYTITKLQYYISNISFTNSRNKVVAENDSYHLISEVEDGVNENSFSFALKPGTYKSVSFLIGVDSIKNISGAQTGALDPLNGMFWTWNTGYIMFKVEGTSPQNNIADKKFEYHIGGFRGPNNVLRRVELRIAPSLEIKKESDTELVVEANLSKLWSDKNPFRISEIPICTSEGSTAAKIADNFSKIFELRQILNRK